MFSEEGYSDYGNAQDEMGNIVMAMSGLAYSPDLGPVGHGYDGSYYPRDTAQDASALNYLGWYPDTYANAHVGTTGSQKGDMSKQAGAWDPTFQAAVRDFQGATSGLTVDGWIGQGTRTALAAAVAAKNLKESPIAPPFAPPQGPPLVAPPVLPYVPPQIIPPPYVPPGGGVSPVPYQPPPAMPAQPVAAKAPISPVLLYGGIALAALAVGYGVYKLA